MSIGKPQDGHDGSQRRVAHVTVARSSRPTKDSLDEEYEVKIGPDWRVLDVLDELANRRGAVVEHRWLCGTRRCGLCGILMNGRPVLSCWEAAEPRMVLAPLTSQPLLTDLVTDRGIYEEAARAARLTLERSAPHRGFPEPLCGDDMAMVNALGACIECQLCVEACPEASLTTGGWPGPGLLVQIARFALDPRDGAERGDVLEAAGLEQCVGPEACGTACETVCPTHVPIYAAIEGLRAAVPTEPR